VGRGGRTAVGEHPGEGDEPAERWGQARSDAGLRPGHMQNMQFNMQNMQFHMQNMHAKYAKLQIPFFVYRIIRIICRIRKKNMQNMQINMEEICRIYVNPISGIHRIVTYAYSAFLLKIYTPTLLML
jgi:hypothetical protein